MPDTTLRQITMLSLVPRRPPGITTEALRSALAARDFDVNLRTVQRDLVRLSVPFPLVSRTRRSPNVNCQLMIGRFPDSRVRIKAPMISTCWPERSVCRSNTRAQASTAQMTSASG